MTNRLAIQAAVPLLLALTLQAQRQTTASLPRVFLEDGFDVPSAKFTAPAWACAPSLPTTGGWRIANPRTDFEATNSNCVQSSGGFLRCWSDDNSGAGGYLAYYHPVPALPTSWRLIVRLKSDLETPSRATFNVLVNHGPNPGEPCQTFPNDDPRGALGFQRYDQGTDLILRDGNMAAYPIHSYYDVPADGSLHVVEVLSTPQGSELRAWPAGGQRPVLPQATGQSLGPARRVLFGAPNLTDYDYSVDYVRLEELSEPPQVEVQELLLFSDSFQTDTAKFTSTAWACDAPIPTTRGWLIANTRPDLEATNTNCAQVLSGGLRCWSDDNSGTGGYLAYYRPLPELPSSWRLITRLKVDEVHASRPVPSVLVRVGAPAPSDPCSLFPGDGPASLGFQAYLGQELTLLDGVTYPNLTGYMVPADGSYHFVELISSPEGSELRAWPDAGSRPELPQAVGASLGLLPRVLFSGPNLENFDYTVDFVRVFERSF
jgi:hypothetical protein